MHHDVGDQPLIGPAGEDRHENQMARGGYRQKLGDALDYREDDDLFDGH